MCNSALMSAIKLIITLHDSKGLIVAVTFNITTCSHAWTTASLPFSSGLLIQHFNICQRLSIHTRLNLEYRLQEEMETSSSWENGRVTVTKRGRLELEVLLFGRFPVLLVLPLPLARVLRHHVAEIFLLVP